MSFSPVDWFLVWWLRSGRYQWSRCRRCLLERRYTGSAIPEAHSLAKIITLLGEVTWTMDGPLHLYDAISYPQTVWARKRDDCDGFSVLAAAMLQRWAPQYRPVLVTALTRPVKLSHTVCAFTDSDGSIGFFDNARLRLEQCPTYGDVVARIAGRAQRLVCWDVREPSTFARLEFHRT